MHRNTMAGMVLAALAAGGAAQALAQGRIIYEERPVYREYAVPAGCNDRFEALRERRWRLEDAMTRVDRERGDIDRAARELADELRNLDPRDRAEVDVYNRRSDAHNRRVERHNRDVATLNQSASQLNGDASWVTDECSSVRDWQWRNVEALPAYRLR